jgi:hypothetical protein
MRFPGFTQRLSPATVMIGAVAAATVLMAMAPTANARGLSFCGTASSPCPASPTPTPVNAFLTLDVTQGNINTSITVTGGSFLSGERVSLYWDDQSKVAGSATADSNGAFTTHVKPFAGDPPGEHKLCASVAPSPCATFTLSATPSPSASPSASPTPTGSLSPTPGQSPTPSPSATPVAAVNGLDAISKPPLVFLPIIGGLGLLAAVAFWAISLATRRRIPAMPAASVSHLATRPDYSAGFGTPPPLQAQPAPLPSAWADVTPGPAPEPPAAGTQASPPEPQAFAPEPEPPAPGPAREPPQPEWPSAPDEPPDLPQPGE